VLRKALWRACAPPFQVAEQLLMLLIVMTNSDSLDFG
jgi:hypothetical protein